MTAHTDTVLIHDFVAILDSVIPNDFFDFDNPFNLNRNFHDSINVLDHFNWNFDWNFLVNCDDLRQSNYQHPTVTSIKKTYSTPVQLRMELLSSPLSQQ